jgi:hypothetical protein
VFPLRFETPGPIVGALSGLVVHGLPDDELARYRPAIEAVTAEEVLQSARTRISPDRAAVVLVGDADAFGDELERAGFGPIEVERDSGPVEEGRAPALAAAVGPVDVGTEGPTEGAEEPKLEGSDDPAEPHTSDEERLTD